MTQSVFIDGAVGTTGLEIAERLGGRAEFSLITLDDARRKDAAAKAEALNAADFVILCLPDDAARESVAMIANDRTRVIDASTAHRTAAGWVYGFAEFREGQREAVAGAMRLSNPGCYSTGFIALIAPLVAAALVPADAALICHAVSGYSGGGKALIQRFEAEETDIAWRGYALGLGHKHVPEMMEHCALSVPPMFTPAVVPAFRGMAVEVPINRVPGSGFGDADAMRAALVARYAGSPVVRVIDAPDSGELLLRQGIEPQDGLDLLVTSSGDGNQIRLIALLDNLGKGASGAAVQNLNIMAGLDETTGLRL